MSSHFLYLLPLCILIFVVTLIFIIRKKAPKKLKQAYEQFQTEMESQGFATAQFYGRNYAFKKINGIHTVLQPALSAQSDWMPAVPGVDQVWLVSMKLPGTQGLKIHLSFLNSARSSDTARQLTGWEKLDENVYHHPKRSPDGKAFFEKINPATRANIISFIEKYNTSASVITDWETVMIGKKNSLVLVGGDPDLQRCADFQISVSVRRNTEEFLLEMANLAQELATEVYPPQK